jgi:predicted O-methyltransferase YrrM
MSRVYRADDRLIAEVIDCLKGDGFLAQDARFNFDEPDHLRKSVSYRDFDFRHVLGLVGEVQLVDAILGFLKDEGVVPEDADYDRQAFEALRTEVKHRFAVPGTSFSPTMERLVYMLSSVRQPQRMIAIGISAGNTLVWNVGSSCGRGKVYDAQHCYGVDIDAQSLALARRNFSQLEHTGHIELLAEDGCRTAERLEETFDYIYLDADNEEAGKGLYLELVQRLYGKLNNGGWVLAHDTTYPLFQSQLRGYLDFVRDQRNFAESISLEVDNFGLELSIKRTTVGQ